MKCQYPNSDNVYEKICGATARWAIQRSTLGYPVNALVAQGVMELCDIHAAAVVTEAIADPRRRIAAMRVARIEHIDSFADVESRRRRIGA